jgi:UDP-N-acetyl-D-mannosaminuronic acid transferase (WecB/TagA/CpsF family)
MAWGAKLAAFLKLGICVLARGDVVQRPGKELMPLKRSPEFVGKHSGFFRKRKPCDRIEADIPDFVAEVAADAFGFDSLDP